jgi:hypothetical protein
MENILYKQLSSKGDDGSEYDVFVNFYDKNSEIMETVVDFELAAFSRYTDVSIENDIITCKNILSVIETFTIGDKVYDTEELVEDMNYLAIKENKKELYQINVKGDTLLECISQDKLYPKLDFVNISNGIERQNNYGILYLTRNFDEDEDGDDDPASTVEEVTQNDIDFSNALSNNRVADSDIRSFQVNAENHKNIMSDFDLGMKTLQSRFLHIKNSFVLKKNDLNPLEETNIYKNRVENSLENLRIFANNKESKIAVKINTRGLSKYTDDKERNRDIVVVLRPGYRDVKNTRDLVDVIEYQFKKDDKTIVFEEVPFREFSPTMEKLRSIKIDDPTLSNSAILELLNISHDTLPFDYKQELNVSKDNSNKSRIETQLKYESVVDITPNFNDIERNSKNLLKIFKNTVRFEKTPYVYPPSLRLWNASNNDEKFGILNSGRYVREAKRNENIYYFYDINTGEAVIPVHEIFKTLSSVSKNKFFERSLSNQWNDSRNNDMYQRSVIDNSIIGENDTNERDFDTTKIDKKDKKKNLINKLTRNLSFLGSSETDSEDLESRDINGEKKLEIILKTVDINIDEVEDVLNIELFIEKLNLIMILKTEIEEWKMEDSTYDIKIIQKLFDKVNDMMFRIREIHAKLGDEMSSATIPKHSDESTMEKLRKFKETFNKFDTKKERKKSNTSASKEEWLLMFYIVLNESYEKDYNPSMLEDQDIRKRLQEDPGTNKLFRNLYLDKLLGFLKESRKVLKNKIESKDLKKTALKFNYEYPYPQTVIGKRKTDKVQTFVLKLSNEISEMKRNPVKVIVTSKNAIRVITQTITSTGNYNYNTNQNLEQTIADIDEHIRIKIVKNFKRILRNPKNSQESIKHVEYKNTKLKDAQPKVLSYSILRNNNLNNNLYESTDANNITLENPYLSSINGILNSLRNGNSTKVLSELITQYNSTTENPEKKIKFLTFITDTVVNYYKETEIDISGNKLNDRQAEEDEEEALRIKDIFKSPVDKEMLNRNQGASKRRVVGGVQTLENEVENEGRGNADSSDYSRANAISDEDSSTPE